jgi:hypothetical protein
VIREEKIKKDQAINKLAEMMMRKDLQVRTLSSNRQALRIRIPILNQDLDLYSESRSGSRCTIAL